MAEQAQRVPYLAENIWGYGKRLHFVDNALQTAFPGALRQTLSVLDIGCGNGSQLAIPLATAGYQVTAVDPHKPSIEHGRSFGSQVRFIHGTVNALPPRRFDCVILSEVLEHLTQPEELLRNALPYLERNGIMVVTLPNGYGEFELDRRAYHRLRLDKLVLRLRALSPQRKSAPELAGSDCGSPHVQRFTLPALRRLFEDHQLNLISARGTSLVSGPVIAHLFAHWHAFVRLNAAMADRLPLSLAAGWMFILKRQF